MNKRIALVAATGLLGLLPLLLITSLAAVAQGGGPTVTPRPSKFATPAPAPKGGAAPAMPAALPPVLFNDSSNSARGTHSGERSTYTVIVVNSGAASATGTIAHATIPWNATYVAGSAAIQGGGGSLTVHAANVEWQGTVTPGKSITFSFQVTLPLAIGTLVTNTLIVYDPLAAGTLNKDTVLHIQPAAGGPDPYGYTYKDSFAPGGPVYGWLAPTLTATRQFTPGDDDVFTGPIPLNFNLLFYGNVYSQAFVSTNGLISFGAGDGHPPYDAIPSPASPNNLAACFWSDMIVHNGSQGVWYQTFGSAPNRVTVVTFNLADFQLAPDAPTHPFQTIFYETSNRIRCQYADTSKIIEGSGTAAVIGLESADGAAAIPYFASLGGGLQVVGPVEAGLALEFTPGSASVPVFATSEKSASFTVHPGEVATFTVAIRNSGPGNAPAASLNDPIPSNAAYVPGSAVATGGIVTGTGSAVLWTGAVNHGQAVTVTYRVVLPTSAGALVSSTATINAPNAAIPQHVSGGIEVLPPQRGGPDPYGYTYEDSYGPGGMVMAWVAPTFTATELFLMGDDDTFTGPIPLNFAFHFYGQVFNDAYVSSNGVVSFITGTLNAHGNPIPTRAAPNNYATCQWNDQLVNTATQGVWVQTFGGAPNRMTVITFRLSYYDPVSPPPPHEFQMILYEGSDQILCQYLDVGDERRGTGVPATIGLENGDGGAGIQYYFDPSGDPQAVGPLENGLAVLFTPGGAHTIFVNSDMEVSEGEHPGEVITYSMHVRNTGVTALLTRLTDPFPAGTAYVPGSAAVDGGGVLNVSTGRVDWQGALNPGTSVTVTYRAALTALSGVVLNTATITEPLEVSTMVLTASTPVQPYAGASIGQDSLYTYRDRYAPSGPAFSWVPTTPQAVSLFLLNADDEVTGPLSIHFNFEFFGKTYSQLFVSTNGLVMFDRAGSTSYTNLPILAPNSATNYATCLWTDQIVRAGDGVWIDTTGAAPNRSTAITFRLSDIGATGAAGPYLYQMILYEGSNHIKCQYKEMGIYPPGDGRAATVGTRNPLGIGGVQYFFGDGKANRVGPIEDGLAILFDPGPKLFLPLIRR